MPPNLHDEDFVAWSEAQAELLRRHAAGERVNGLDWANIIEEIEGLGRSETQQVVSLLTQAMVHRLKIARWPTHPAVGHWSGEAASFLAQAQDGYLPSMARKIDVARCFAAARRRVLAVDHQVPPEPIPASTPLSLAELMDQGRDLRAALDALVAGPRGA